MRAGRGREPQMDMSAEDAAAIVGRLYAAGLAAWVDGGWGVDALVRRQTRPHDDLDLVVRLEEVPAVERELAALGYERAGGGPPMSFESVDPEGRQVDVHPIAPDGAYLKRDETFWYYALDGLRGRGAIAGRAVDCLTAAAQVIGHADYELDEDDLHDLRLLRPPPDVLAAAGAQGELEPLGGGTGRTWRCGGLVFKPVDFAPEVVTWQGEILGAVRAADVRVAPPRLAGDWIVMPYLEGRHEAGRWLDVIEAGRRLHAALPQARPPAVDNAWETGDRVAWGELAYPAVDDLLAALEPVDEAPALIHGDLTGNVLFHDTLPPAVIDFAPYFRPPTYAAAIVVADAVCWEGAPESLLDAVPRQFLLRALVYRGVTSLEFGGDGRVELDLARRIAAG